MRSRLTPSRNLPPILDLRAFASPTYCIYVLSAFFSFLGLYTRESYIKNPSWLMGSASRADSTMVSCRGTTLTLCIALTFLSLSATYIGMDPSFVLYLTAISNGTSGVGRIISGVLAVIYGPMNIMILMTILAGVFTYIWPFVKSEASFVAITCLYG